MSAVKRGGLSLTLRLGVCIVAVGLCAAAMLSLRQARLQAAHEMGRAQERILSHDARWARLRSQIATETTLFLDRHGRPAETLAGRATPGGRP